MPPGLTVRCRGAPTLSKFRQNASGFLQIPRELLRDKGEDSDCRPGDHQKSRIDFVLQERQENADRDRTRFQSKNCSLCHGETSCQFNPYGIKTSCDYGSIGCGFLEK